MRYNIICGHTNMTLKIAGIAQSVEHFTRNEGVPSSNLGFGSRNQEVAVYAASFFRAVRRGKSGLEGRVNYSRHKTQKLLSFRLRTEHRADYREVKQGRPRTGRLYPPYPRPLGTQDCTTDFQPDRRRPQNRFHDKITRYVSPSAPLSHVFSSPEPHFVRRTHEKDA